MRDRQLKRAGCVAGALVLVASLAGVASAAKRFSDWGAPVNAEAIPGASSDLNTTANDGCPIESPDGRSLYIASNRPGGLGGQDIWVAQRQHRDGPWGTPVNLGAPVNSSANDFCPTPLPGQRLLFVSERVEPGSCGLGDIYSTKQKGSGWTTPVNLGCDVNSPSGEAGPSLVDVRGRTLLFFSSQRPGGPLGEAPGAVSGDSDIYVAESRRHDDFGPAVVVAELSSAYDDFRPNVRKDGREIVFDSNRPGGAGGQDIWSSESEAPGGPWSEPWALTSVNTPSAETRASISRDGRRLTFGSNRPGTEGMADVYVSTRDKAGPHDDEDE